MYIKVIKVGNSKGLRIPKSIIEEYEIEDEIEMILKEDHIELHPKSNPRSKWRSKFKKMANLKDDELLIPDVFEDEEF